MKNSILENSQEIVNNLNNTLTGYTIESISTVARGRGFSKTLLIVTIESKGWIANVTFNAETFYIEKVAVLGETNKSVIDTIDTEIRWMFDDITKVINEVVNNNVTIEIVVLKNEIIVNETNSNDTTYTVANKSFNSYDQALSYCNASDFDAEIMIITEVVAVQPLNVESKPLLLSVSWLGSNEIKSKVSDVWNLSDTTKSFKQYCKTKEGKQLINDMSERYINKAKNDLVVQFIQAYVKGDELYLEIESDVNNIISLLSYKCGTMLDFMDATYKLEYVS